MLGVAQHYIDNAVFAPLETGTLGAGYHGAVRPGVQPARRRCRPAALTDLDVGKLTASPTTATPVDALGARRHAGEMMYLATDFDAHVKATTDTGPLKCTRHVELTFAPGAGKHWLVTRVPRATVDAHDAGAATTTTTTDDDRRDNAVKPTFGASSSALGARRHRARARDAAGIFAAWLAGVHIPIASGATYLRVEKIAPLAAADRVGGAPTAPFFILLVGNDSRPGVGGARGDALHVLGVNPAKHQATMLDIPRDTCWDGDKINAGNTHGPRAQAERRRRAASACTISYVVDVDFAGFTGLVDGVGGVDVNVPTRDARLVLGRVLQPGQAAHERHCRRCRSRATATTSRRATSSARTTRAC